MRKLVKVKDVEMTESQALDFASVFFEEVASNLYYIKKHRTESVAGNYVDGREVAKELNNGVSVAVKTMTNDLMTNFTRKMQRQFLLDTLNREII